jgi:transposase
VLTDARGVPLGLAVSGANTHDQKLVAETLDSQSLRRPRGRRQHLCLDKGYDASTVARLVARRGYVAHLRTRGEEQKARRRGHRARRWVVERAHSWTNRARRLLVRWEKKAANYVALVHLQFAYVALKVAGLLG